MINDPHETPPSPDSSTPRGNATWVDADYAVMVDGLRTGRSQVEIAQLLGRTTSGVRRRMGWLAPEGIPKSELEDWLRATLAEDKHYDWRAALRQYHLQRNQPYFDDQADRLLMEAWATARPMPEVAAELHIDEFTIARQLIALGLSSTLVEVAERLGASTGSVLDQRVRLTKERLGAAVWVLVVDGLADGRHVSIHDTEDDATTALTRLRHQHDRTHETVTQLTWTVAHRAIAGGSSGETLHDKLLPLPTSDGS